MFCLEHLHTLRQAEIAAFARELPPGARILEIGGGTGAQAKALSERGFDVTAIDIPSSNYAEQRVFPVRDYDGEHIPYPDATFDVVFSSNVLEHVPHLPALQREMARVLKPGGFCLHALPSGAWRFWTSVAHYMEVGQRSFAHLTTRHPLKDRLKAVVATTKHGRLPPRHGERGNVLTEMAYFSRFWWKNHFKAQHFEILSARPMGLFYTGHMILGKKWGLKQRQRLAPLLGSACLLYKVRPQPVPRGRT